MKPSPALKQLACVVCLFLVAGLVPVFGAARPTRTSRKHRALAPISHGEPAKDDIAGNDDPIVRQIAQDALGHEKGSVLAVDPTTGRILTIINQRMAFSAGFEPCSTIKPFIALAGLQEGVITRDTMIKVGSRRYMDLTEAMAHSNNKYFEAVGSELGFDRLIKYHELFGLGQKVGYNIPE